VLIHCGGATVYGVALIHLVDNNITHPGILLALIFGVISGFLVSVTGFLYAWEHMRKIVVKTMVTVLD
jgi:hypothetical protein